MKPLIIAFILSISTAFATPPPPPVTGVVHLMAGVVCDEEHQVREIYEAYAASGEAEAGEAIYRVYEAQTINGEPACKAGTFYGMVIGESTKLGPFTTNDEQGAYVTYITPVMFGTGHPAFLLWMDFDDDGKAKKTNNIPNGPKRPA